MKLSEKFTDLELKDVVELSLKGEAVFALIWDQSWEGRKNRSWEGRKNRVPIPLETFRRLVNEWCDLHTQIKGPETGRG